jgi:hypothetical protein
VVRLLPAAAPDADASDARGHVIDRADTDADPSDAVADQRDVHAAARHGREGMKARNG